MKISIKELATATGATTKGAQNMINDTVTVPLTDSRSLTDAHETVFFAIKTKLGDGHDYIRELEEKGVRCFVVKREYETPGTKSIFLKVDDPQEALEKSGAMIRNRLSCPVIGITGSRGKTVVKEMLNAMLLNEFEIARSPRSWNSQIGVPLSLWQATEETTLGIFEAGISQTGEMTKLQSTIRPTTGIFTSLTDEHEAGFSSAEEKCEEKARLFKDCSHILYVDDNEITGKTLRRLYPDKTIEACSSYEELCVKTAGMLGIKKEQAEKLQTGTTAVTGRIDITDTPKGTTLVLDHFTCDYPGIETGLDTISRRTPKEHRLTAIIGDLTVSDRDKESTYAKTGRLLRQRGVETLYATGKEISAHSEHFKGINIITAPDGIAQLTRELKDADLRDTSVYINGSEKAKFALLSTWLTDVRNVTQLEVNLDSIAHNYRYYRGLIPRETGIIGMIKASAYGCGALEVAKTLQNQGADMVAVAVVDEGVALRKGGVTMPILVLDPWCENMRAIFANNLEPTVIEPSEDVLNLLELSAESEDVETVNIHVKLDTGMHRVGLLEDQLEAFMDMLERHPRIRISSVFSHLATADCLDKDSYTEMQLEKFKRMSDYVLSRTGYKVKRHVLNTAGMSRYSQTDRYELARLGIGLYGISPLDENDGKNLKPVARLVTRIIAKRQLTASQTVGYGCNGVVNRPSVIGTLPIGYADGIDRHLGNGHATFMVNGTECPTIGNICMDLCMIDLTDCKDCGDDTVEIFGPNHPIEQLATILDTIPYEILTSVSPRVKRVYYRE